MKDQKFSYLTGWYFPGATNTVGWVQEYILLFWYIYVVFYCRKFQA